MKPILILQQISCETPGSLETYIHAAGVPSGNIECYRAMPEAFDPRAIAGLVVLGGPMNVDETDQHPFLAVEVDWMRRAVEAQTPLLGVCLGAQLLAKTLGAAVRPNGVKEIGWYEIDLLAAAEADPLFGGGPSRATVFQWHGDTFDLPRGAELLATGRDCRHQAFRFGPCAWGLQFHVEMTAALIDCWLGREHNCAELAKLDYIDPAAIRQATPARLPEMDVLGRQVLSRFVELCRARA